MAPRPDALTPPDPAPGAGPPALAVVLVTFDSWRVQERTLESLRAQTIADRLEVILVGITAGRVALDARALAGFHSHRVVATGPIRSITQGHFRGARQAAAPLVAFGEDHCFPDPDWAESLVRAHAAGPWAAVGPVMRNANPGNRISRADMLVAYGRFTDPASAGERDDLPGHNSCYKAAALRALGESLEGYDHETLLCAAMRARGQRLFQSAEVRSAHANFARPGPWTVSLYATGRAFAAQRAGGWGWPRRLAYAAAWPLIPPLRLARLLRSARTPEARRAVIGLLPELAYAFTVDAAAQAIGNLLGAGHAVPLLCEIESRRYRYVRPVDVPRFAPRVGTPDPAAAP